MTQFQNEKKVCFGPSELVFEIYLEFGICNLEF